jgi:hypothetical protein
VTILTSEQTDEAHGLPAPSRLTMEEPGLLVDDMREFFAALR